MTDKEKILAEIERRRVKYKELISKSFGVEQEYFKGMAVVADEMMSFINSLPAEQQSEELEEEIKRKYKNNIGLMMPIESFRKLILHFTQWQKEQMMKSAFDGEITKFFDGNLSVKAQLPKGSKCCFGDKVKVIIMEDKE